MRSSLARVFSLAFCVALFLALVATGCGRSSLEIETVEGGVDAGPGNCNAANCPTGCCDTSGTCRTGSDVRACGRFGARCSDCVANGFQFCNGNGVCGRNVTNCSAANCATGCCSFQSGTSACLAGVDAFACGRNGSTCTDCASQGRSCDTGTRSCSNTRCDSTNCAGCCVGDRCLAGTDATSCGTRGQACTSCAATGQTCRSVGGGGGTCQGTPTCGPANCGGCCQGTVCVTGSDATSCGRQGQQCNNCTATGQVCGADRTCQTPVTCGPANCPGCCVGNNCVVATTPAACGKGGEVCRGCAVNETCNAGTCTPTVGCSAANCAGCCIGDVCAVGTQPTACGLGGIACQNCQGMGRVCQGGTCQQPVCGPANCAGCCSGNVCVLGTDDAACGQNGAACTACGGAQVCQGRQCVDRCGPGNCAGCCGAGNACLLGFTSTACGSGGANCTDCRPNTCNTLVVPRICSNLGGNCPAAYPACPAGVSTAITPSIQNHCADVDLDALQAACATGPDSASCVAAFAALGAIDAACATCLQPFNVPFTQLTGIYTCVAPFVTAACNRSTGCASDCGGTSCGGCAAGAAEDQCRDQVNGGGGQCNTYVNQTACIAPALGAGSLCNPARYGNYGGWLRAVGDHFCGNGP